MANIGVIVPAGGSGNRMGGVYKPMELLCGKEMILYSLETFEKHPDVAFVVISAKEDKVAELDELCKSHGMTKVKKIVEGGSDRQKSVENAFKCGLFDDEKVKYVAIHDAARPLFDEKMATSVFEAAKKNGTAVCACNVRDTVKRTDGRNVVTENIERDNLWLIQTPQVFEKKLYADALVYANETGFTATDDSSLVIHMGHEVFLCNTPSSNIKVTYPEDVVFASALINYRKIGE